MPLTDLPRLAARILVAVVLSACVVTTAESPPPRTAAPPAETHVAVAPAQEPAPQPPPPAVTAAPQPPPPVVAANAQLAPPTVLAPPPDGRYPIQIDRGTSAGRVFRMRAQGSKTTRKRTAVPGQPPRTEAERLSIELSGLVRIVAVDTNGDPTHMEVTVEQCRTESSATGDEPLLRAGAVIVVESPLRPARGRFLVAGNELDPRISGYLEILFNRSHSLTSDDDVFGTSTPRRRGERWDVNAALIAADLSNEMPGLTPADVRGRTTFHGPAEHDGRPVLDVGVKLDIRVRAMPNLPPGTVIERGQMKIEIRGLLPRDTTLPSLRDRFSMQMRARLHVPTPAGTTTLDMEIEQERTDERTPVR